MRYKRAAKGQLAIELGATCVFLLVFVLVGVNIGFLLYGANINDKACRDCARAAAQAKNSTTALNLANATLAAQRLSGDLTGDSIVTRPVITSLVYEDYGAQRPPLGTLQPNRTPFVRVTTQCSSTLPFAPPQLLGNTMPGSLTFRQTYSFPIVQIN